MSCLPWFEEFRKLSRQEELPQVNKAAQCYITRPDPISQHEKRVLPEAGPVNEATVDVREQRSNTGKFRSVILQDPTLKFLLPIPDLVVLSQP